MKSFSFNTNDLLPQLTQVASVVGNKNAMAILSDIVLKTYMDGEHVAVLCTASDSENFVSMKCNLVNGESGIEIAVDAKNIVSTLQNLSGRVITLEIDEERRMVKGNYQSGYFEMPYDDAADFPSINVGSGEKIERLIDAQVLHEAISSVKCSIGNDSLRPVINSIHFDFLEDGMTSVSFDGFKMSKYTNYLVKSEQVYGFNLPHKACRIISSMIQKMDGDVKLTTNGNNIVVSRYDFRIVARLHEGKYPPYNMLIQPKYPIQIKVNKSDLVNALKIVSTSCNESSQQTRFTFTKGKLTINAENLDFARTASEEISCDYEGNKFEIAFKYGWVLSMLSNIDDESVVLKMLNMQKPALIVPDNQDENAEYIYLIMPMLILI